MTAKQYYTKEEVMKLLNKPSTTFQREVNAGIIPSGIEEGRKYPKRTIDAYISLLNQVSQKDFNFALSTNSDFWLISEKVQEIYDSDDNVSYKRLLEWKDINNEIFMSAKEGNKVIGGVTIIPLAESTIHLIINGKIQERNIPNWAIKQWNDPQLSAYIASIAIISSDDKNIDNARGRFLIRQTIRWIVSLHNQYDIKNWYSIAVTDEGERFLQSLDFKLIPNKTRKGYIMDNIEKSTGLLKNFLEKTKAEK